MALLSLLLMETNGNDYETNKGENVCNSVNAQKVQEAFGIGHSCLRRLEHITPGANVDGVWN